MELQNTTGDTHLQIPYNFSNGTWVTKKPFKNANSVIKFGDRNST